MKIKILICSVLAVMSIVTASIKESKVDNPQSAIVLSAEHSTEVVEASFVPLAAISVDSVLSFFGDYWPDLSAVLLAIGELIVRIKPTSKSYSIITNIINFINKLIPDKSSAGGTH